MNTPLIIGVILVATTGLLTWAYYRRGGRRRKLLSDHNEKHSVRLIERKELSHNTRQFRFQLPENTTLGLVPGQHIYLSANINGSLVVRTYSPVSTQNDVGFFDLIIKVYFRNQHPNFPNGGKMTQFLNDMRIGEHIQIRGPGGRMVYDASSGEFAIQDDKKSPPRIVSAKKINMIAGGSGITPMLQVLKSIFLTAEKIDEDTCVSMIYANQTEDDILCRSDLEELVQSHPKKLQIHYTLSLPPPVWNYGVGRVNKDMFQKHLFPSSTETIVLLCGPPGMINSTSLPALKELGYDSSRCFVY